MHETDGIWCKELAVSFHHRLSGVSPKGKNRMVFAFIIFFFNPFQSFYPIIFCRTGPSPICAIGRICKYFRKKMGF
jgi:hypothetical protein